MKHVTVMGRMGWFCWNKCASFSSKKDNTLPKWAFKLNIALAATENGHLKGCMLKLKCQTSSVQLYFMLLISILLRVLAFT
jgi:hypothetical protein